ncbi:hypothetical protein Mgra_00007803 [Meloidogyne graminicola]|uniref:Uncharacterized protein n=1 Tax=Meloidogyne graminicola TaxID=189291 RepID=A0A8S9ZHN8_9BILA|nr:hypothetical protein Mgra_00007803 [Meloidogyne graminicola]
MALCLAIFDKEDVLLFLKIKEKGVSQETSSEIQRFLYNSFDIILDKINYPGAKGNSRSLYWLFTFKLFFSGSSDIFFDLMAI